HIAGPAVGHASTERLMVGSAGETGRREHFTTDPYEQDRSKNESGGGRSVHAVLLNAAALLPGLPARFRVDPEDAPAVWGAFASVASSCPRLPRRTRASR